MKFLFDFDGVLTDQTEEALRVRELFADEISRCTAVSQAQAWSWIEGAEQVMASEPTRHGWRFNGRITAFSNEDLFIRNNGTGAALDLLEQFQEARGALRARDAASFETLADAAFDRMALETGSGKLKPLDRETRPVLETLLTHGHSVVIVSNSGTERIRALLASVGVEDARIRIRGGARKFELGSQSRVIPISDYAVEVDRPLYRSVLLEERPDVVVGDVYSLDLALPIHLSRTGELGPLRALLRTRHYTPGWSRAADGLREISELGSVLAEASPA